MFSLTKQTEFQPPLPAQIVIDSQKHLLRHHCRSPSLFLPFLLASSDPLRHLSFIYFKINFATSSETWVHDVSFEIICILERCFDQFFSPSFVSSFQLWERERNYLAFKCLIKQWAERLKENCHNSRLYYVEEHKSEAR